MIRLLYLVALMSAVISACGDDPPPPEPHEVVDCDSTWKQNGYDHCEGPCVTSSTALLASGPSCAGLTSNGPVSCQKTFEYMEIVGCCISSAPNILFAECQ